MKIMRRAICLILALIMTASIQMPCIFADVSAQSETVGIKRDGPADIDWSAKWIWSKNNTSGHNWLCLRKTVDLDSVP